MAPSNIDALQSNLLRASFYKSPQEEDEVCLYPSKKCTNLRAKKKNGELHTMCEYHRIRANENQRRLERRRKAALRLPNRHEAKPSLWNREFPEPIPMQSMVSPRSPLPYALARSPVKRQDLINHWQPIEIEILLACLFGDGDKEQSRGSDMFEPRRFVSATQGLTIDLGDFV